MVDQKGISIPSRHCSSCKDFEDELLLRFSFYATMIIIVWALYYYFKLSIMEDFSSSLRNRQCNNN
jgi:hypothetical protein